MNVNIMGAAFAKRSKWPVYGAKNRHLYGSVNVQGGFVMGIVLDVGGLSCDVKSCGVVRRCGCATPGT